MNVERQWRDIAQDESSIVRAIVSASHLAGSEQLVAELDGALVSNSTQWILDIKPAAGDGLDLPNGPFPGRAFVQAQDEYRGEIIVWISDGHLSGLEYAWVTDAPPTRWPRLDELEVFPRMPTEYDVVRLRIALPEHGLEVGAEGTVVMDHSRHSGVRLPPACEVEFTGINKTVTVAAADLEVVWQSNQR